MQIEERKVEFATPWFELISKRVKGEKSPYYALRMPDYVTIVALTGRDELILVRQYRPAVENFVLELPSGHVEKGEQPVESARRELAEECGFDALVPDLLGPLISDTGRNENRMWCYFAHRVLPVKSHWAPEPGVERVLIPAREIAGLIARGEFSFSMHVAALTLAWLKRGGKIFGLDS